MNHFKPANSDTEAEQGPEIVNASMFLDALKSSGYKSTYNAIAEIVDNSIDANASNILILGDQGLTEDNEKGLVEFGFLDDGCGMNEETLRSCLTIGYTTNHNKKNTMGRFGVGLPQASLSVCNRVEVYSWQNGIENCKSVHLDVEEIKQHNQNEIDSPKPGRLPEKYKKFIHYNSEEKSFDFSRSGTLVIWKKCTNVDHKKWSTCVNHMSMDLGRKYRYFLASNKIQILRIETRSRSENKLLANDPLYLRTPSQECVPNDVSVLINNNYQSNKYNSSLGYTDSLFEQFGDPFPEEVTIKYLENGIEKTGKLNIKYSVVKEKYYSNNSLKITTKPGMLSFGKTQNIKTNVGISVVRNQREIDFGYFGFFNEQTNSPEYRWWGVEIDFNSDLDGAFKISNNKQSINLVPLSPDERKEYDESEDGPSVWLTLYEHIHDTIVAMTQRNERIRSNDFNECDSLPSQSSQIVKTVDADDYKEQECNVEVQREEAKGQLINEGKEATESEIEKFIDSKVRVAYLQKGKHDSFIDKSYAAGTLTIIVNTNHPFYRESLEKLVDNQETKTPVELLLIALMKTVQTYGSKDEALMDNFIYDLNRKISDYMRELDEQDEK